MQTVKKAPTIGTGAIAGGHASSDTVDRAQEAVKRMRKMMPGLRVFARALTRNPRLDLQLSPGPPCTDGKTIWLKPPIELGDKTPHERAVCGERDEKSVPLCTACRTLEGVETTLYHEIAHIVSESFAALDDDDRLAVVRLAVAEAGAGDGTTRAAKIAARIEAENPTSYVHAARLVSPFLPALINALEDARVNTEMYRARPGTYKMFKGQAVDVFERGILQEDGTTIMWREQPRNIQVMVGCLAKAMGYDHEGWFSDEVNTALADPDLARLLSGVASARSMKSLYRMAFPVLERLRALGFCRAADDPEDDDQDESDEQERGDRRSDEADRESDQPSDEKQQGEQENAAPEGSAPPEDDTPAENEPTPAPQDGEASDDPEGADGAGESGDEPDGQEGAGDSDSDQAGDGDADSDGPQNGDSDGEGADGADDDADAADDDAEGDAGPSDDDADGDDDTSSEGDGDDDGDTAGEGDTADADGDDDSEADCDDDDDDSDADGEGDGPGTDGDDDDDDSDAYNEGDGDPDGDADGDAGDEENDAGNGEADGDADAVSRAVELFGGHGGGGVGGPKARDHYERKQAELEIDRAIVQGQHFDEPSSQIFGVNVHRWSDRGDRADRASWAGWRHEYLDGGDATRELIGYDLEVEPGVLIPALARARVVFSDNKKARKERNLRGGRINTKALGRRVPIGDDRLFQRKREPGAKDYFVVIGLDNSGSTSAQGCENLKIIKQAGMAKAELLHRLGIKFAVYAHNGWPHENPYNRQSVMKGGGPVMDLDIVAIKEPQEPWGTEQRERLRSLTPSGYNLDGHAMEFYRKVTDRQRATDKLVLYYTDGAMPAANYDDELRVLQREIRDAPRRNLSIVGVGVRTDSPRAHGLDTIRLDSVDDVPHVVAELESRLTRRI